MCVIYRYKVEKKHAAREQWRQSVNISEEPPNIFCTGTFVHKSEMNLTVFMVIFCEKVELVSTHIF